MKTKILIIAVIFGIAISCNDNDDDLNPINFTEIGQNNLYGSGEENILQQNLTISDSETWNDLLDKMNTTNNESDEFTETDIDFEEFVVIAVFDKIYGNGGHSIDIIKITENENKVIVKIENIMGGDATSIMTQPFHIVKIPKTDKLIIFE